MLKKILALGTILLLTSCYANSMKSNTGSESEMKVQDGIVDNDPTIYQTLDEQQTDNLDQQTASQEKEVEVQDRVFFVYDSSEVNGEAKKILDVQVAWLKSDSSIKITIEGHCDERGTRAYNLALGERRAEAARSYLVSLGVPQNRLTTVSYGKERPAVLGSDESSWAQNRRSVTVISY